MTFPNRLQKTLVTLGAFGISFAAAGADPAPIAKALTRAASSNAQVVIPMVNWTVPQFFGAPAGVTSSMATTSSPFLRSIPTIAGSPVKG